MLTQMIEKRPAQEARRKRRSLGFFAKALLASGIGMTLSLQAMAIDLQSTTTALRMANTITGGFMPTSDPLFAQMVAKIQAGDTVGAAQLAATSKYFASYFARRMAFQMQNPTLDASTVTDSDATAFIIAHLIGAGGVAPSISSLWSENATYLVNLSTGSAGHAASLTAAQLQTIDWGAALVRMPGQSARDAVGKASNVVALPAKHVGGYLTLSDRGTDNSFASYGATAGTNLRMIEGIWEIATGLQLVDVESQLATAQQAPRFVPEYDPNFFHGQGQAACISCHGGGFSSLTHGYATVADVFDFDTTNGLVFNATPTTATMKSLGSDPKLRATNLACSLLKTPTAVCNPDSAGVDPNNGYDLSATWAASGVLQTMGWTAPMTGQGLNQLGAGIGRATIVYDFLTARVINELCPMGNFSPTRIAAISNSANPTLMPPGTDDIRTIVAQVAADPSCL